MKHKYFRMAFLYCFYSLFGVFQYAHANCFRAFHDQIYDFTFLGNLTLRQASKLPYEELLWLRSKLSQDISDLNLSRGDRRNLRIFIHEVETQLLRRGERAKAAMLKDLNRLKTDPKSRGHISDLLEFERYKISLESDAVGIWVGGQEGNLGQTMNEAKALVTNLVSRNYQVILDADAHSFGELSKLAENHYLAITSDPKKADHRRHFLLLSPYLRLEAIRRPRESIASLDSSSGLALLIDGNTPFILDPEGTWSNPLSHWKRKLSEIGINLGIHYTSPRVLPNGSNLFSKRNSLGETVFPPLRSPPNSPGETAVIKDLDVFDLRRLIDTSEVLTQGVSQLGKNRGTVIFGTSQWVPDLFSLITGSTQAMAKLNPTIVTGGSGGAMEMANQAAKEMGAISIGVPLGGVFKPKREDSIPRHFQDLTVVANGYESRIALLLHQRDYVLVVPGGSGTMQEVATAILLMAGMSARGKPIPKLIFVGGAYYGPLTSFFDSAPEVVRRNIVFAIDERDLGRKIKDLRP